MHSLHQLLACVALVGPSFAQTPVLPPIDPVEKLPPNILIVVADDVGVDLIGAYGESSDAPCTPTIDALAAQGMLFRNAWACPTCSPTRASLLTGRHGFRTGIGDVVANNEPGLSLSHTLLPELLTRYSSACIGKWHLAGNLGAAHPNASGFQHFHGFLRGAVNDYSSWSRVVDGQTSLSSTYTIVEFTDEAITQITSLPEPWLVVVNYNAPHSPFHVPPAALCPTNRCPNVWCETVTPTSPDRRLARAMMEALDVELGALLAVVDATHPDSYVFFMGDNGTASSVSMAPFTGSHAKGTVYEGGVNVPLIVRGPGVLSAECNALVSATDVYATVAQLARVQSQAEDSVSLAPYFTRPNLAQRQWVYTERFTPNGAAPPFATHDRAIRDARYKLIRRTGQPDEFYDLEVDPFELNDLRPTLSPAEQQRYDSLAAQLISLGVG